MPVKGTQNCGKSSEHEGKVWGEWERGCENPGEKKEENLHRYNFISFIGLLAFCPICLGIYSLNDLGFT